MAECWFPRVDATSEGWQAALALYDLGSEAELERQAVGAPEKTYNDAARKALAALGAANAALAFGPGGGDG
jgi:hypothetical protein